MAWIKRNLYFLVGSIVALALMIAGGFYLFTQISEEGRVADEITRQYAELTRLINLNPHPGYGQIDNNKAAKSQAAALRAYITKTRPYFQRITPIPDTTTNRITDSDFAAALRVTVTQLHHSAEQQSVILSTPDYYFTFEAQKKIMIFDPASLGKLAVQLGEIKAISEILFAARVNSLDYIRRESVSADDKNQSDYLPQKTVSTPLADLTPYEVKFRCFHTELALVLGSLASSPNGFIVKTINVEPTAAGPEEPGASPTMVPTAAPVAMPVPYQDGRSARLGQRFAAPVSPIAPAVSVQAHGPFLNEKPFTVTLLIQVVKTKSVK